MVDFILPLHYNKTEMEKYMTKKRSIYLFIFLSVLLVVGLICSFVSFTYPFSINGNYYRYSCFVDELVLGADVSDGVVITYNAKLPDGEPSDAYDDYMQGTVAGLKDLLKGAGYKDSTVTILDNNQISVNVGNITSYQDQQDVISLIGSPKKLKFSSESSSDSSGDYDFLGKYVKSVEVKTQDGNGMTYYYVDIQLDATGTQKLKELTEYIVSNSKSLYMYLGDTAISSNSIEDAITDGHITMYSEENFVDRNTTQQYVTNIKSGLLDMELVSVESGKATATLGHRIQLWLIVAFIVMIVASFVYLAIRFRELGLMGIFNMLFYIVIGLGLLQSIPFMHLNISGLIAIAMCYAISLGSIVSICLGAKEEFKTGKKLHTCFKLSQSKNLFKILISNIFMFATGVICALMPTMHLQSFGMVALVLSLVNIFTSLVWFRLILKLYTAINPYNAKRCDFKVEEGAKNVK